MKDALHHWSYINFEFTDSDQPAYVLDRSESFQIITTEMPQRSVIVEMWSEYADQSWLFKCVIRAPSFCFISN